MYIKALKFVLVFGLCLGIITVFGIIAGVMFDKIEFGNGFLGFLASGFVSLILLIAARGLEEAPSAADRNAPRDR